MLLLATHEIEDMLTGKRLGKALDEVLRRGGALGGEFPRQFPHLGLKLASCAPEKNGIMMERNSHAVRGIEFERIRLRPNGSHDRARKGRGVLRARHEWLGARQNQCRVPEWPVMQPAKENGGPSGSVPPWYAGSCEAREGSRMAIQFRSGTCLDGGVARLAFR